MEIFFLHEEDEILKSSSFIPRNIYAYQPGGTLSITPANIKARVQKKGENLFYDIFRTPRDYSKEITDIEDCAKWSNEQLRKMGYNIWGDAWTRTDKSNNLTKIISGYDNLTKPSEYNYKDVRDYLFQAADNVKKNLDVNDLQEGDIVGLYYRRTPNLKKAYENGLNGEAQTHTGHIVYIKNKPFVAHNIHGDIILNNAKRVMGSHRPYGIVSVYRPNK